MKILVLIKMVLLLVLTLMVMIVLMPAMIFGGTKFLGEVYRVFSKEFRKLRGVHEGSSVAK